MRAAWGLLVLAACGPRPRPPADLSGLACPAPPHVAFDEAQVATWVATTRQAHPELDGYEVVVRPMRSDTVFFKADISPGTLLRRPARRTYRVHYSTALFADPPPPAAVVAILDHELEHGRHYTTMSSATLAGFALDYAIGRAARYERSTDRHPVALGCGEGLARYREWLYPRLSERQRKRKRATYLTPDEARAP